MKRALCEAKSDCRLKIRNQKSCENEGMVAAHCQRAVCTEVQGRSWAMPRAGPIPYLMTSQTSNKALNQTRQYMALL